MKRKLVLGFMVLAFVAVSSNAQALNYGQRLVGTWVLADGGSFVFNANGTGTIPGVGGFPSVNFYWDFSSASGRLHIESNFPPRPADIPVRDWNEIMRNFRSELSTDYVFLSPDGNRMLNAIPADGYISVFC